MEYFWRRCHQRLCQLNLNQKNLDVPIVSFINQLLNDAINKNASDIHLEPFEKNYRIRFRCDGILTTVSHSPIHLAPMITSRIKILSNLDISERRVPQDGRFSYHVSPILCVDFRVSTCPTLHGEKIVLRLLESNKQLIPIDALGMSSEQINLYRKALNRPQGLILVTGPTGSGKTMTLYSGLSYLNTIEKNICSAEDPIEIQLAGINQVPVNLKTGLTFSTALKAFLRQDPDVIMVGEIRDRETADIAINASLTGHLVLATLHTNSASECLVRLSNMGVPAYNIASSISLIIAQRLIRRLCPHCKILINNLQYTIPRTVNCKKCHNGYNGRVGIFEVMPLSTKVKELISNKESAIKISQQAQREKIQTLRQSGLEYIRSGLTSLAELNRIIHE